MSVHHSFQAQEILAHIGLKLRAAREVKGLTLQEIANRTRINHVFLEKIETGDTSELPALAFLRGFIRNYMQVLELEDPEIEEDLKKIAGIAQGTQQKSTSNIRMKELHDVDEPSKIKMPVIIGLAVLVLLWGGYMAVRLLSDSGSAPQTAKTDTREQSGQTPAGEAKSDPATGNPQPTQQAGTPGSPAASNLPLAVQQNLRLTMKGLEATWVRLSIDRAPPIDVRLEPAETREWEANEEIRLTVGKSNGVSVYLNGEDIVLSNEKDRLVPGIILNKLTLLRLEN